MDDKDQVKMISSLDFDISKVNDTMKNLNSIFEKNMQELEKKVKESTANINNMIGSIGGININAGGGVGNPQQAAKEINKNLANVMANAVKHLNKFIEKLHVELSEQEMAHAIQKDVENIDKEIAKYVRRSINLATSDIREELQRVPVWARSKGGAKLDDVAYEVLNKFPALEGYGGNTPSEMLLNFFDTYKAYNTTKKQLLEDMNKTTQDLAKVNDYAGRSINEITDNLTKNLETVLNPKELDKFKGLSFEGKRDYLINLLQKYRMSLDDIADESTQRIAGYIDDITGQSKLTPTKSDHVKQAVNNLNTAQENLQKRIVNIINDDIRSISEIYKLDKLNSLKLTNYFDKDGNISTTAETHTMDKAKLQTTAYKDLFNLQKQLFDLDNKRVGASEKQLQVIKAIETSIEGQMADVYKIIEVYGLENAELEKNLMTEAQKLGNANLLKKIKDDEVAKTKELNALEKKRIDMQNALPKMEATAATIQQTINTKELSAELLKQAGTLREQINLMQEKLTKEGKLTNEEVEQTAELKKQLDLLQQQTKTAAADKPLQPTVRESPFMARMQTALSYGMIYKGIQAMKEAVTTIKDVEMGITEIARVTEDASFNFDKVRDKVIQLGIDYGQSFENVQDISLRWAQAGYNIADTLELTKTSLLALNTAELDAQNATESLIGIMAQWNLTAQDLPLVLDKINKVGDDFTVTSQDLVDGLLRSSGAAKIMGLSIEQTIALLTTMREASGRTGREVGNALNSILSYIQRAGSIKVIESMGIRMFADEARTQFRNVFEVFQELATKWNDPNIAQGAKDALMAGAQEAGLFAEELANVVGMQDEYNQMTDAAAKATENFTDTQKRDAAQAAAGVYRRNYFIGLLEKFATTQEVLISMNEAEGYSMRENERTMGTLEKKVQSLKTSATQLAVAIGEAGLLDSFKNLVDLGKDTIEIFNGMNPVFRDFVINFGVLFATIEGIKLTSTLFGITESFKGLVTALNATNTAFAAFSAKAGAFMATWGGPIALGLMATSAIILTTANHFKKLREEKQRLLEGSGEQMAEIERLNSLITKYSELSEAAKNNASAKEELLKLQRQLAEEYPQYVDGVDSENNLIVTNIELLKELNRLKKEELELKRDQQAKESKATIGTLEKEEQRLRDKIEANRKRLETGDTYEKKRKGSDIVEIDITKKLIKEVETYTKELQENLIEQEKHKRFLEEYSNAYDMEYANRIRKIEEEKNANAIAYVEKNKDSEEFYAKVLSGHDKLVKGLKTLYGYDLKEYKTLAQAKADIEMKLLSGLATQWSNYYNAQTGVLSMEIAELQRLGQYDPKAKADFDKIMAAARVFNQLKNISIDTAPGSTGTGTSGAGDGASGSGGSTVNTALREYLKQLEHKKRMDELSIEEEIAGYEYALKHYAKTADEKMDLTEKIYSTKKRLIEEEKKSTEELNKITEDTLTDQMNSLKDAYDERIKMIDKETETKKKAQQDIIDGIDKEIEAMNRREKGHDHERKLADLNEKLRYHQMRTGVEHEEAIKDIEKQIAEENHDYQNELMRQGLEDKKQAAQDEIKNIEENAENQKTILKNTLDSFDTLFNGSNKAIISAAMAMSREYAGIVDNMIETAKKAIRESNITDGIEGYDKVSGIVASGKESQQIKSYVSAIVDYKRQYNNAAKAGNKEAMNSAYESAKRYYNLLESSTKGKGYAEQLQRMNYEQARELLKNSTFHDGGKNMREGLALIRRDEIMLNPRLSEAFEKFTIMLSRTPIQTIRNVYKSSSSKSESKSVSVDKAVNIEHAYFEDDTDIEIFGREMKRVIEALP